MPCYDGSGPSYNDNSYEMQKMKERNDLLARVACRALTELEDLCTECICYESFIEWKVS